MDDKSIIELYLRRSPDAGGFAAKRFGDACYKVAFSVLRDEEMAEKCLEKTWEQARRLIPPARPVFPAAFFAKLTRDIAFDEREENSAVPLPSGGSAVSALNDWLYSLSPEDRTLIIRKDWLMLTPKEAAASLGMTEAAAEQRILSLHDRLAASLSGSENVPADDHALMRLFGRIDDELVFLAIARTKNSGEVQVSQMRKNTLLAVIILIALCVLVFFLKR